MAFDAVKCTVGFSNNQYEVVMTVRYLDAGGLVLASMPVSAKVDKGDLATMRAALVATLRPLLDAAIIKLQEQVTGTTNLATNILTQVNTYLAGK